MHRPDECKRALCLLRGTAGGFFKTSHAVTSEARVSSSSVQGACDSAAEKAEVLDRLPAKRAPMLETTLALAEPRTSREQAGAKPIPEAGLLSRAARGSGRPPSCLHSGNAGGGSGGDRPVTTLL